MELKRESSIPKLLLRLRLLLPLLLLGLGNLLEDLFIGFLLVRLFGKA